jgi:hypothetical protein
VRLTASSVRCASASGGGSPPALGGGTISLTTTNSAYRYPFSVGETVGFYRRYYGPTQRAFAALSKEQQPHLRRDLEYLWAHNHATDGTTHVEAEYLEVVARRT